MTSVEPVAVVLVRDETPKPPKRIPEIVTTTRFINIVGGGNGTPQRHLLLKQSPRRHRAIVTVFATSGMFLCASKGEADSFTDQLSAGAYMGNTPNQGAMIELHGTGEIWAVCTSATTGFIGVVAETRTE